MLDDSFPKSDDEIDAAPEESAAVDDNFPGIAVTEDDPSSGVPPSSSFAVAALLLPPLMALAIVFAPSANAAFVLRGATVLATALLLAMDVHLLARCRRRRTADLQPLVTLLSVILFWIVCYPLTFFRRRVYAGPNLAWASLGSVALLLSGPVVAILWQSPELPKGYSPEVLPLMHRLIQDAFPHQMIGEISVAVDDSRSDVQVDGHCIVRINGTPVKVSYRIEWQDRDSGQYSLRLTLLPGCASAQAISVAEVLIRKALKDIGVQRVYGYRDIDFTPLSEYRLGECVAETEAGEITIQYQVEWLNHETHEIQVLVFVLPSPTSEDVRGIIDQVLSSVLPGMEITSIDGHRETHSDWKAGRRFGVCQVHADGELLEIKYVVRWKDSEHREFIVELLRDDSI